MKTLTLIKRDLFRFIKYDIGVFSLLIFSLAGVYFSLLIISGVLSTQLISVKGASMYTSASVLFHNKIDHESVLRFLNDKPLGETKNVFMIHSRANTDEYSIIGWKGTAFTRWHALEAGRSFFTEEQVESEDNITILNMSYADQNNAETQDIEGTEYRVIMRTLLFFPSFLRGLDIDPSFDIPNSGIEKISILPYKTFFKNGFSPDILRIDMANPYVGKAERTKELLLRYFPDEEITLTGSVTQDTGRMAQHFRVRALFYGMSLLALLSVFSLFDNWIYRNSKQYQVYSFCGASRWRIINLIILEWVSVSMLSFGIGIFIVILIQPFLSRIHIDLMLNIPEVILIFIGGTFLSFLFSIKAVISISRTNCRPIGGNV